MTQFYYWNKDRKERDHHQEQINLFRLFSILKMIPPLKLFSKAQLLNSFVNCFRIRILWPCKESESDIYPKASQSPNFNRYLKWVNEFLYIVFSNVKQRKCIWLTDTLTSLLFQPLKGYYLCGAGMEDGVEDTQKDMEENLYISNPVRNLHPFRPIPQRGRDHIYLYTGTQ